MALTLFNIKDSL